MKKIKAIFIDFDWTIYDHNTHSIPPSTIFALNKAKANGVKLFLNSARTYYSLLGKDIINLVDFDAYGVINGCASFNKQEIIHSHFIEDEDAKEIISICKNNHLSYLVSTLANTYIDVIPNDPLVKEFYKAFAETYPLDISLYDQKEKLVVIQVFYKKEDDYLFEHLKNRLSSHRFFDYTVEFNEVDNYKQEATNAIMNYYHLAKEDCMALGDDLNDIDMFHSVGTSVCMGNGNEEAKKNASYITANIEDDGIYKALEHFKVI